MTKQTKKSIDGLEVLSQFGQYLHYLKWNDDLGRYETWEEAVDDVMSIHKEWLTTFAPQAFEDQEFNRLWELSTKLYKQKKILGSQRVLQMRRSILKHHAKVYNCITMYADKATFFSEYMYWLLCGCGVGVSVQQRHIHKMAPVFPINKDLDPVIHTVEDSIEGWSDAIAAIISSYAKPVHQTKFPEYFQRKVVFDFSRIRPKGSFISGGFKAPGPEPLERAIKKIETLLEEVTASLFSGEGKFLRSIHIYDIGMYIADAVISGGVRRSATIYLFGEDDTEMSEAKAGNWFIENPQRGRSNNSVVLLKDTLTKEQLEKHIENTKQFGEPGIVLVDDYDIIFNPCVEIGMMPKIQLNGISKTGAQGCNLTEINGAEITEKNGKDLASAAAFLGTIQATYTDFKYVDRLSKLIFEKEALIGVSITGWFDNQLLLENNELKESLAKQVVNTNEYVAKLLGINPAARTTCVKPSGNASVVLKTSSGVTPQHSDRYFRNVQVNKAQSISQIFKAANPEAVEESVWSSEGRDYVISFPVEHTKAGVQKQNVSAVDHLKAIQDIQTYWVNTGTNVDRCTHPKLRHNVSNTVTITNEGEWNSVVDYIYQNNKYFTGISLLAGSGDRDYQQAPFTTVLNEQELVEQYGAAAIFASGLIVDGLHAFNDLWQAISSVTYTNPSSSNISGIELMLKADWIRRFKKFADNYFEGDLKKTEYCLKDCYNFHRWNKIVKSFKTINWAKQLTKPDFIDVDTTGAIACNGDSCVINLG